MPPQPSSATATIDRRRVETIGYSEEGRPIETVVAGPMGAPLRILVIGTQHGDERRTGRAIEAMVRAAGPLAGRGAAWQLAAIATLNPDGAAANSRLNARGVDLNRDHQVLASAECRALHRFVRQWRPHLVIDVHTYPPRRRHLLAQNLAYCHDIFLDIPTNLATGLDGGKVLGGLLFELGNRGIRAGRYTLVRRSGRIRHGTPDVVDARNALALRYGITTLLIEGRQTSRRHDTPAERRRVHAALNTTLVTILQQAAQHPESLIADRDGPAGDRQIAISSRYKPSHTAARMLFQDTTTGAIHAVDLPGRFSPSLEATWSVSLPTCYAVPRRQRAVLDLLYRHGFTSVSAGRPQQYVVQEQWITSSVPSRRPRRAPRELAVAARERSISLEDHILFPTAQSGGHALAVLLEPQSKYGLLRHREMGLPVASGARWPILRISYDEPQRSLTV